MNLNMSVTLEFVKCHTPNGQTAQMSHLIYCNVTLTNMSFYGVTLPTDRCDTDRGVRSHFGSQCDIIGQNVTFTRFGRVMSLLRGIRIRTPMTAISSTTETMLTLHSVNYKGVQSAPDGGRTQ
jgi:hypothetical protein